METKISRENNILDIEVKGRLDTVNAPVFEKEVGDIPQDVEVINIRLDDLDYIASSGLRALLSILKKAQKQDSRVVLIHPKDMILEILETTGFTDIFEIEE